MTGEGRAQAATVAVPEELLRDLIALAGNYSMRRGVWIDARQVRADAEALLYAPARTSSGEDT